MEARMTIRMSAQLVDKIKSVADKLGIKKSDVARMAITEYLEIEDRIGNDRPYEKIHGLCGVVASGVPDLGERHREHLIERIKNGA